MSIRLRTRKDGSPYWQVRFRENGHDCSVSWNDPIDAQNFDKLIRQVGPARAREVTRIIAAPSREMSLRTFLEKHNDGLAGLEPGTIARYRAYVRRDIGPALGDIPLTVLSRDDIAGWIQDLTRSGASGKTIKNKRDYLAGALRAAVIQGLITRNPCEDVKAPRWDRADKVFLEHDEFDILLAAVPEYWQPLVEFLVASGCRWSEATALNPNAVDRQAGTVRITKAWKTGAGGYVLGVPKTKRSVRTINVPTSTLDKLDYSGEWLFTNSGRDNRRNANPGGPVRNTTFNPKVWQPAVARAQKNGLTKSPRLHDLRHTCASWLIQAGRPLPAIQAHLGHESIQTTVDVYGSLDRTAGRDNADIIAAILRGD